MLFWIFVIGAIACIAIYYLTDEWHDSLLASGVACSVVSIIMIISIICLNFAPDTHRQQNEQIQESIQYKIESGLYKDNLNILDKDIITEIKDWNNNLIFKKQYEKDFWIGIFIPNIYADLKMFDYQKIK